MVDVAYDVKPVKEIWDNTWNNYSVGEKIEAIKNHKDISQVLYTYIGNSGRVLDAGCGLGGWLYVVSEINREVVGVDYVLSCLRKIKDELTGTLLISSDVTALPFKSKTFRYVICLGVIEHVENVTDSALNELLRVCDDEATVIISVPYKSLIFWRKRVKRIIHFLLGKHQKENHFFEYCFTKREFHRFIERNDLKIIEHIPYGHVVTLFYNFGFLRENKERWNYRLNRFGTNLCTILMNQKVWLTGHMQCIVARRVK
ncbi:MAG: class I SAM-dependent methyltransferase [Candidatus Glassbacteria bacterium]